MSEFERKIGNLTPINADTEAYAEAACEEKGWIRQKGEGFYIDTLIENDSENHIEVNGELYSMEYKNVYNLDRDILLAEEDARGRIKFDVSYYKGICLCLSEAIELALD